MLSYLSPSATFSHLLLSADIEKDLRVNSVVPEITVFPITYANRMSVRQYDGVQQRVAGCAPTLTD